MGDYDDITEDDLPWDRFSEDDMDSSMDLSMDSFYDVNNILKEILQTLRYDEVRGVAYLELAHQWRLQEEFETTDQIRKVLARIGKNEAAARYNKTKTPSEVEIDRIVDKYINDHGIESFFRRVNKPENTETLATARELTLPKSGLAVQIDLAEIDTELIRHLARHPEKMRDLSPRKFEELIAELFKDKGYQVELTKRSRDGGLDIRVFQRSGIGSIMALIECKRYAARNPVAVQVVRGLYGVVEAERATKGIIATTSYFTGPARSFQSAIKYRMELADFGDLKMWLNDFKGK